MSGGTLFTGGQYSLRQRHKERFVETDVTLSSYYRFQSDQDDTARYSDSDDEDIIGEMRDREPEPDSIQTDVRLTENRHQVVANWSQMVSNAPGVVEFQSDLTISILHGKLQVH